MRWIALWTIGAVALAGCVAVETTEPTPVTVAQFDPSPVAPDEDHLALPAVPTPSNMLLDPETGRVQLPLTVAVPILGQAEPALVNAFSTAAAEELATSYVNTLYGYTRDSALETGFAGAAIDAETVNADTVQVIDITPVDRSGVEPAAVEDLVLTLGERDESGVTALTIARPAGSLYEQGHTYAAVITTGVTDVNGDPVASSYIFNLLKSTAPLATAEGLSTCALPDVLAQQLEALRAGLFAPLFDAIEPVLPRGDVALAWTFSIRPGSIALNDPLSSVFPTPNELVMASALSSKHDCDDDGTKDCQSGHLCFPIDCEADSPAQQAFFQYMNGLDGWPASMPITAGFSLPLDPTSVLPEAVGLTRITDDGTVDVALDVSLDESGEILTIKPHALLEAGARYAAYIKTDFKTAGSNLEIRPSTITAVTRLASSVFEGGQSAITDFGVGDDDAFLLEIMRLGIDPLIKTLGLDESRERIASLWEFKIHSHNEALYDPTAGLLPFPNDVLMALDDEGNPEHVNVPLDPEWPLAQALAIQSLNTLDGFSTLTGTRAPFLLPLAPGSFHLVNAITDLVGGGLGDTLSLAVADVTDVDPAAGVEGLAPLMDGANILGPDDVQVSFEAGHLVLKPMPGKPLKEDRRYMIVAFDNLKSVAVDGDGVPLPVEVAPVFFLSRSKDPLVDKDGASQVTTLTDGDATMLEALRTQYDAIFSALESEMIGVPRERVVMFWTLTTQSIGSWFYKLKKKLVTLSIGPGTDPGTVESGEDSGLAFADKIVMDGSFAGFTALETVSDGDDETLPVVTMGFDEDGTPAWQATNLPLMILVPTAHDDIQPPFPVAIIQHGLYGDKEEVLAQADTFLEAGYAVVSMDLPFHGERVLPGRENGDGFFVADPLATRDHILECAFNIVQLVSYIGRGNSGFKLWLTQATGEPGLLDTDRLYFIGNSLGAMAGTLALAATDEVSAAALVVPAGNLTRILIETPDKAFQEPINDALEGIGLAPGSEAYQQFIEVAQALLDRADPVNYARHITAARLPEASALPLFILTAGKDGLMPKSASKELVCAARGEGYPFWKEYKDMCHAFLFHSCDDDAELEAGGLQAAADILAFFADNGDASTVDGVVTAAELECQDW